MGRGGGLARAAGRGRKPGTCVKAAGEKCMTIRTGSVVKGLCRIGVDYCTGQAPVQVCAGPGNRIAIGAGSPILEPGVPPGQARPAAGAAPIDLIHKPSKNLVS